MKNDNGNIPKTEKELEEWMKANCANFNSYSINGNAIYEGFGIEIIGGTFIWYYTERGQKDIYYISYKGKLSKKLPKRYK